MQKKKKPDTILIIVWGLFGDFFLRCKESRAKMKLSLCLRKVLCVVKDALSAVAWGMSGTQRLSLGRRVHKRPRTSCLEWR